MTLPFSLKLFEEIEIYQTLREFEYENKLTWKLEKLMLLWISSSEYNYPGSSISSSDVTKVVAQQYKKGESNGNINKFWSPEQGVKILEALELRGFGRISRKAITEASIFYPNKNCYMAAKVLAKTKSLTDNTQYSCWIFFWWTIFSLLVVLLILQVTNTIIDVISLKAN